MNFRTFTLKSTNGLLLELKTPCQISMAYATSKVSPIEPPKPLDCISLWDTGASGTVVSQNIVKKLGLKPTGKAKVYHAHGHEIVNTYMVNLCLPNQTWISLVEVSEGILNNFDILIGMDIINKGDFSITNFNDRTIFSFRYPSACDIDFFNDFDNKPHFHLSI
jgi:predicted aspartyl protease